MTDITEEDLRRIEAYCAADGDRPIHPEQYEEVALAWAFAEKARTDLPALASALRESWRERDEAREGLGAHDACHALGLPPDKLEEQVRALVRLGRQASIDRHDADADAHPTVRFEECEHAECIEARAALAPVAHLEEP